MRPRRTTDSNCNFCDGKTVVETKEALLACTTCGAEDPDFVPFFDDPEDFEKARLQFNISKYERNLQ